MMKQLELPSIEIFCKGYTKNWLRESLIINSVLETNRWSYKIKDLNGEKIIGSFYEKLLFKIILKNNFK